MTIVLTTFVASDHLDDLKLMLNTQNSDVSVTSSIPRIGIIAHLEGRSQTPVAAGFLRMVEGGFAQIDGLTSNANLSSNIRHLGLSKVVSEVISQAKSLGVIQLHAFSKDKGTLKRAEAIGFRACEHTLIALSLGDV